MISIAACVLNANNPIFVIPNIEQKMKNEKPFYFNAFLHGDKTHR